MPFVGRSVAKSKLDAYPHSRRGTRFLRVVRSATAYCVCVESGWALSYSNMIRNGVMFWGLRQAFLSRMGCLDDMLFFVRYRVQRFQFVIVLSYHRTLPIVILRST